MTCSRRRRGRSAPPIEVSFERPRGQAENDMLTSSLSPSHTDDAGRRRKAAGMTRHASNTGCRSVRAVLDRVEHVGHRPLARQRLVEVVEQLGVADGDRRLLGERIEDAAVAWLEGPHFRSVQIESPPEGSVDAKGDDQQAVQVHLASKTE